MRMLEIKGNDVSLVNITSVQIGQSVEGSDPDSLVEYNINVMVDGTVHHGGIYVCGYPKLAQMIVELLNKELEKQNESE